MPPRSSHLGLRLDATTLISHSTLIFSTYLLLTRQSPNPCCADIMSLKGRQWELMLRLNYLELLVHLVSKPAGSIKNLNYLPCPVPMTPSPTPGNLLQCPEVTWHTVWEPWPLKILVGVALKFHLIRVSSMTVFPFLLPLLFVSKFELWCRSFWNFGALEPWLNPPFCQHNKRLNYLLISLPLFYPLKLLF